MNIDWANLGFGFYPVKSNLRFHYADGSWDDGTFYSDYNINISVAANAFHYGQAIFEGLKAFRGKDGKVRIFRPDANAKRLCNSAAGLMMPEFPEERFVEAVRRVVADNIEFVPPYGTGGAMYIRPVMFGSTPQIGVGASKEYELVFMVLPVGSFYSKGGIKPVNAAIMRDFDRAAPHGVGQIKAAGNYAASLRSANKAKSELGCQIVLYLDPATHSFIDEFGTSNFFAIDKAGHYVTPQSESILASITNDSLMTVAADLGMQPCRRQIETGELAEFSAVAACGTAVVLTPVAKIIDGGTVYEFPGAGENADLLRLRQEISGIQYAEIEDRHHWMWEV